MIKSHILKILASITLSLGAITSNINAKEDASISQEESVRLVPSCLKRVDPLFGTFNMEAKYYIYTKFGYKAFEKPSLPNYLKALAKEYKKMKRANVELILVFADYPSVVAPLQEEYDLPFAAVDLSDLNKLGIGKEMGYIYGCEGVSRVCLADADGNSLGTLPMDNISDWKKAISRGVKSHQKQQRAEARKKAQAEARQKP